VDPDITHIKRFLYAQFFAVILVGALSIPFFLRGKQHCSIRRARLSERRLDGLETFLNSSYRPHAHSKSRGAAYMETTDDLWATIPREMLIDSIIAQIHCIPKLIDN
jgi:hypothetical protein